MMTAKNFRRAAAIVSAEPNPSIRAEIEDAFASFFRSEAGNLAYDEERFRAACKAPAPQGRRRQ